MSRDVDGGVVLRGGPAVRLSAPNTSRIPGLDIARTLAILGMLAAHTLPGDGNNFYDGRSSILFATVAGVSLGLMTGGEHRLASDRRSRARLSITIRSLLLIALGLGLWLLGTNIAIILDSYGFYFLVCIPLLFANRWVLGGLAVLCALIGPTIVSSITAVTAASGPVPMLLDNPLVIPLSWLDSYYPAPVWLAYVLIGLTAARFGITRPRTRLVMIVGGGLVAALGYGISSAVSEPVIAHTDTTMEAVSSGALAIALIGLLVTLAGSVTSRAGKMLMRPLVASGSMPLSIYTAQVIVIALIGAARPDGYDDIAWPLFASLAIASVAGATVWSMFFSQGPLEWLFARLTLRRPWRRTTPTR